MTHCYQVQQSQPIKELNRTFYFERITHNITYKYVFRIPGGFLSAPVINDTGPSLFGNDVKLRTSHLATAGHKAWVDHLTRLPAGLLQKYFFYVHNTNLTGTMDVHIQIWRLVADVHYTLVWQKIVPVNYGHVGIYGALYEVCMSQGGGCLKGTGRVCLKRCCFSFCKGPNKLILQS